jgi:tagatose 1,6-diphosphate aldolase
MKISPGKLKGLNAVSDERGVIRAAAMDQRGSLRKSIAKERGTKPDQVTQQHMEEFKTSVTKILTPHATAILLDPEYGVPAVKARSKNAGVLLAYESTGYDNTQPGRMPTLIPDWSVQKSIEAGADCIKILLYYSPFEKPEINAAKHDWVQRIGEECEKDDIPYFLEFVGYDPQGGDVKGLEFAKIKPKVVADSMREFSKDQYKVDVLKVEIPVNLQFTEGTQSFKNAGTAYSKKEAMELYQSTAEATNKPFIYLSAGVSDAQFRESLEIAIEAGVNFAGVLCGRATWKEGIPVYAKEGVQAFDAWLSNRGVKNIQALNKVLEGAHPWQAAYGGKEKIEVATS